MPASPQSIREIISTQKHLPMLKLTNTAAVEQTLLLRSERRQLEYRGRDEGGSVTGSHAARTENAPIIFGISMGNCSPFPFILRANP
jgi:hypothetical protein